MTRAPTTCLCTFVVVSTILCSHLNAALELLLTSDPGDLTALRLGETVVIDVALSGLSDGDSLEFLAATVEFDGSVFGTPDFKASPIVPDPDGFVAQAGLGLADGFYDALFSPNSDTIDVGGVLYSFELTALDVGQTEIGFTFGDSIGFGADGAIGGVDLGGPLSATVLVPEPKNRLVFLIVLLYLVCRRRLAGQN